MIYHFIKCLNRVWGQFGKCNNVYTMLQIMYIYNRIYIYHLYAIIRYPEGGGY